MRVTTKHNPRAGNHRWPFDGNCAVCGMTPTRFADTKEECPGERAAERERFTVPEDDLDAE